MSITELGGSNFASFKPGNSGDPNDPSSQNYNPWNPGDPGSYGAFIEALITDARDYEMSVLAPDRDQATKYYYGYLPRLDGTDYWQYSDTVIIQDPNATYEDLYDDEDNLNKSSYVSTDVRDSILGVLPSLVRIFGASENVVSLVPRSQRDVATSEQATDYVNYTFWQDNPGFLILYGAFKDAMTVKTGFVKWWTDDSKEIRTKTFQNINVQQIQLLMSEDPSVKIIDHGDVDKQAGTIDHVVLQYEVQKPIIKVMGVPPEEMRLDRQARTWETSRITGHERVIPIDDLVAMGYPRELCNNFIQSTDVHNFTQESQIRNPGRAVTTRVPDGVNYGEWYIRVDKDGDGIPELRYVCTMGEDHQIVHDEPANRVKFALFSCDPVSHTIVGDSVADLTIDIQRIKTNVARGVLDSLAESINPRMAINELVVNVDDAMNDDLGAVIRSRGNPGDAVAWSTTPFVGQQAVPVLQMLDQAMQRRTGLSDAAKGLDPKALQSSTMIGVDAIISGQQERIELIARVLAETGFKNLFQGIYDEICENPAQKRVLRIRGNFIPFDTSTFDATMGVEVNPTLGKGTDVTRMAALQGIKQDQTNIVQQMGIANPFVTPEQMMNTITDMLSLLNIKNVQRYFTMPSPQVLQQMMSAPKEPDPMTVSAKAQMEKVKADSAAKIGQQDIERTKNQSQVAHQTQVLHEKSVTQAAQLALKSKHEEDQVDLEHQRIELDRQKMELEHQQAMAKLEVDRIKATQPRTTVQ